MSARKVHQITFDYECPICDSINQFCIFWVNGGEPQLEGPKMCRECGKPFAQHTVITSVEDSEVG